MSNVITPKLAYSHIGHRYALDGRPIRSTTQIISAAGMVEGEEYFTDEARERGRAVHEAIHYHNEGDLDESTIDPRIAPYFEGYKRFMAEARIVPYAAEMCMAHPTLRYGGTTDLLAWWHGGDRLVLFDFKTGVYAAHQEVQLSGAYLELVEANADALGLTKADVPTQAQIVTLTKEGKYKLPAMQMRRQKARAYFMSALNLQNYKEQYHGESTHR